ncbi:hypothetical protein GUJ93_ZPchr0007g3127 [Zizania palustris]|uniref:Uncharacterized protein n=1 Tax=Zizania palustris TaxID=103762 RepID=A0A8J5VN54_ZIZPA|nr:hypothetical protein GUJ93_ZPchr0007g3127 [Zizania palustris]
METETICEFGKREWDHGEVRGRRSSSGAANGRYIPGSLTGFSGTKLQAHSPLGSNRAQFQNSVTSASGISKLQTLLGVIYLGPHSSKTVMPWKLVGFRDDNLHPLGPGW